MTDYLAIACNGLHEELFANPLSQLVFNYLNPRLPARCQFKVVGGIDPRPFTSSFTHWLAAAHNAGKKIIWIGHSLGAMMAFYQADALNSLKISSPLFISIDPTDWGTNVPGIAPWLLGGSHAGEYLVPPNVDRWIQFRQPVYPGGGRAHLAPGNDHTKLEAYERLEPHVALPVTPAIQEIILSAVTQACQ